MSSNCRAAMAAAQSDPDRNRAFRNWLRPCLPQDAAALDKLADFEMAGGRYAAADRLAWLAAGIRESAQ